MENQLFDRMKGGLYGVAVGDALGGTTEFMSAKEVEAKHGYLTEIIGGGVWSLEPGEVTDDTMMTLCVAEGILEHPKEPMEAIGRRFMAWYGSRPKDIGNIIRHVFEKYEGDWFEAAFVAHMDMGQSGGNGSLMRCLLSGAGLQRPGGHGAGDNHAVADDALRSKVRGSLYPVQPDCRASFAGRKLKSSDFGRGGR